MGLHHTEILCTDSKGDNGVKRWPTGGGNICKSYIQSIERKKKNPLQMSKEVNSHFSKIDKINGLQHLKRYTIALIIK
jgi:hypothetical protein